MDLLDASVYFDDDPVYDGYTAAFLFNAQVSSFNDSRSDGATDRRRILSVGPGLSLPTRQVVQFYSDYWVVGTGTPDGFYGEVARQHFNMKRATDLMSLLTPAQALTGAAGTSVWVHKLYFKDTANGITDSEADTYWNVFIAPGEAAAKGSFFKDATGRLYRVRNDYVESEGLRICASDSLEPNAFQTVVWGTGTFDPINDTISAGTVTANAIIFETEKFYRFKFESDASLQKGDTTVFVPTILAPKQGDQFTLLGKRWRALDVQAELDCWAVHARLV